MALKSGKNLPELTDSPTDTVSAKERILQSAEKVFGNCGYDGTSLRRVAEDANVPVALVSYHFNSKQKLYRTVFERRAPTIVEKRLAGLDIARGEKNLEKRVELIVKALVLPMLQLRALDKNPSFGRIIVREATDPNSEDRGLMRDLFDPVSLKVMEALSAALPNHSPQEVAWAYHFMLGALVFVMSDSGRIARLSGGKCHPDDEGNASEHMVRFLTAGTMNFLNPPSEFQELQATSARAIGQRKHSLSKMNHDSLRTTVKKRVRSSI